jgi:SAM-dependent methyltransferase
MSEYSAYEAYRRQVVTSLRGSVLEIGAGLGGNLALLDEGVTWQALEPDRRRHARLSGIARRHPDAAAPLLAAAEDIPLPDASVDGVLSVVTMCSVADADLALWEVRRCSGRVAGSCSPSTSPHQQAPGRAGYRAQLRPCRADSTMAATRYETPRRPSAAPGSTCASFGGLSCTSGSAYASPTSLGLPRGDLEATVGAGLASALAPSRIVTLEPAAHSHPRCWATLAASTRVAVPVLPIAEDR